jgi:hypothetical protein
VITRASALEPGREEGRENDERRRQRGAEQAGAELCGQPVHRSAMPAA